MQVSTKSHIVTTRTHTAVFSADEIKNVALLTAKDKAGVQATVTSSDVKVGDDGSITVEIVETITADADGSVAAASTAAPAAAAAAAVAPAATQPAAAPIQAAAPAAAAAAAPAAGGLRFG